MNQGLYAERVKDRVDLHALAASHTVLTHWARREEAGPCPRCGGKDRFHVYDDDGRARGGQWWKCYRCHPRPGDAIEFVRWLEHCDYVTALNRLAAQAGLESPQASPRAGSTGRSPAASSAAGAASQLPLPLPEPEREQRSGASPAPPSRSSPADPGWQERAQREAAAAVQRLWGPDGELARRYLASRSLLPLTARAWGLGFVYAWHPRQGERRPAIALPWRDGGKIMAIQYRFIPERATQATDVAHGDRFSQKPGGVRRVYGLHLLAAQEAAAATGEPQQQILVLVEGEFNALSIWQALHNPGPWAVPPAFVGLPVDVLSFGSENGATAHELARLAAGYDQVIVWTDRSDRAA
ncbi:MAG TPA: primase-helicase zinc-binding domain-containing protein, partial [Anaerolineae bacterium]